MTINTQPVLIFPRDADDSVRLNKPDNFAKQQNDISKTRKQSVALLSDDQPTFVRKLKQHQLTIERKKITTLQVNIGLRCDLACTHCHVEAGPKRTENMTEQTITRLIQILENSPAVDTVDITGGAPELNPYFRKLVIAARRNHKKVIDRCNLTVLHQSGQEDAAEFLAENQVEIVASLPCYTADNVDQQRGKGVFGRSVSSLQKLNQLGYASDPNLRLNLVYNPVGEHLPPPQETLQADYKVRLKQDLDISFNELFTITNMPIKRYAHYLKRKKKLVEYMQLLIDNFNPTAVNEVMCKMLCSISWDGYIHDCDFNQMLEMPLGGRTTSIWDIESTAEITSKIALADHCYGCTAGAGSSCGGSLL